MKTLLSIALFTAILHADTATEMPDSSQQAPSSTQEMPAQTTPDSSQQPPAQDMPDSSTEMGDAAPPMSDPSQQTPSSTQEMPPSDPEMGDSAPAMTAPSTTEPMQQEEMICEPLYGNFILTEFKMGYFRFGDRTLRHIYSDGVLDIQLTSSFRVWRPLYIYAAIEYIGAKGRTLGGHERTKIRLVPLSLGLQYIQPITFDLKYYLTVGPRVFHFHQKNHSVGVPSTVNKWGCGGFINTGFMYYLTEHIIFDFFGEYSYKRMHFKTDRANVEGNSLQIGGLTLGAGIGYFW
jgi:hypothetical protein